MKVAAVRFVASVAALTLLIATQPVAAAKNRLMPPLSGVTSWLNTTEPPTRENLRGKVVLVDFWTYSCINCIRTFPHLKRWHERYAGKGLVIIGIHSPEFAFESEPENVKRAVKRYAIPYPVGMDDSLAVWKAFGTKSWPTHYLLDRTGVIRESHSGEGNYEETEKAIQSLLSEGGVSVKMPVEALPVGVEFSRIKTPEIYLGYERLAAIGNRERIVPDQPTRFSGTTAPGKNRFLLDGEWKIEKKRATMTSQSGRIAIRFDANKANMVLRSSAGTRAEVWIDGKPATESNKGEDVVLEAGGAVVTIDVPRLYNLVNGEYGDHTLELRIVGTGLEAYTFTFG